MSAAFEGFKLVLAEKVVGAEKAFSPYRVKIMETHYFKTEKSCMDYFQKQSDPATE